MKNQDQMIKDKIMFEGDIIRQRYPWLVKYQDVIGLSIFLICSALIVMLAVAYMQGAISAWLVIPAAAVLMSILHELEHDLIHLMYFRKNKMVNSLLLIGVWLFRPSTINPLFRRKLHIHHHKTSGQETDFEERAITNGEKWGLRRLLMTGDNLLAVYLRPFKTVQMIELFVNAQKGLTTKQRLWLRLEALVGYFPLGFLNYAIWHAFVVISAALVIGSALGLAMPVLPIWAYDVYHWMTIWVVCIAAPNAIRTFALHFVSSNIHYYGNVANGRVVEQCQVWTSKWVFPLHLFCFNFGATHAIHHFVVRDPFYIRQWLAPRVYATMKENGVIFNDFGTFKRANRRAEPSYHTSLAS